MRQRIANVVLSALLIALANPGFSAEAPSEPAATPSDAIENFVVTGQRPSVLRKLMLDFVVEIGDPVSSNRGYARWRDDLCVGVQNLTDRAAAQYLADEISRIALELGLEPGEPGCSPNLRVIFSQDGRAMATRLVAGNPRAFRPFGGTGGTTQGLTALDRFQTSDAPVRWWQITMVVDEMGFIAIDLPYGAAVDPTSGLPTPPQIRGSNSRLKNAVSDELWGALVIVDASKLARVKWSQLADYLAMVSLAQVNPDALPSGYDSILNLFNADRAPEGLTDMDRTYLQALYEIDTMMVPHAQRGMLAGRMVNVQTRKAD